MIYPKTSVQFRVGEFVRRGSNLANERFCIAATNSKRMVSIKRTDDVLGGEPRIADTRVGVLDIYELVAGGGYSPEDIADQLDLSLAQIYAALAYYHERSEEMRELRRERDELESRLSEDSLSPPEPAQ